MKLKTAYIGLIFTLLLFLGIGSADALDLWKTESSKVPLIIQEGEFAGAYDPGDIRGSYSFGDIEESFGVPVATLAKAFGINSDDPSTFLCKELEVIYVDTVMEVGTGSVRQFVAYYTGLPYESDDGFPATAVQVLKEDGLWTDTMAIQLDGRIITISDSETPEITSTPVANLEEETTSKTTASDDTHEAPTTVTGKTTVAEAIDLGLTLTDIEEALGVEITNHNITIKDLCSNNGLSFSAMKDQLNSLLP